MSISGTRAVAHLFNSVDDPDLRVISWSAVPELEAATPLDQKHILFVLG